MKLLKKILILSLSTIIIIYGVLFYFDNYIFSSDNTKITSKHTETKKTVPKVANKPINNTLEVDIPNDAINVKASYDGSFIAYQYNRQLMVVDTKTSATKKLKLSEKSSFFTWLPDRNRLLIDKSIASKHRRMISIDTYDTDSGNYENVCQFRASDKSSTVTDIKVATLVNSTFIKTENNSGNAQIYYQGIMKHLNKLRLNSKKIGNIEAMRHLSHMIYEDTKKYKVYISNSSKPYKIDGVDATALLKIDSNDKLYIGSYFHNKILKIYSKDLDSKDSSWQVIKLKTTVEPKNIIITEMGKVYINYDGNGSLYDAQNNNIVTYSGKLIDINDNKIISLVNGNKIIINDIIDKEQQN